MHFSKKSCRLSAAGSEIVAFGSHWLTSFRPILNCFVPNVKLKYEDSEDIETNREITVVFNLHHVKQRNCFWDSRYTWRPVILGTLSKLTRGGDQQSNFCSKGLKGQVNSLDP